MLDSLHFRTVLLECTHREVSFDWSNLWVLSDRSGIGSFLFLVNFIFGSERTKFVFYWDQPGWVGWVGCFFLFFFTCSTGNSPFSVGSVDQLFQPTRNPVELVENDGYRPLSQSWALIRCVMSTNAILFNTVGVWCPLSPGIRPCFQLFQPKTVEMRSIGTLQPHQPKPVLVRT